MRDEQGRQLTRDHPKVIKARLGGVGLSTILSAGMAYAILDYCLMRDVNVSVMVGVIN